MGEIEAIPTCHGVWKLAFVAQKLSDKEIVARMGKDFYSKVFSPAIQKAYEKGKPYVEIRDAIRKEWKPD